jgi:acyl transferase domain-containing protein
VTACPQATLGSTYPELSACRAEPGSQIWETRVSLVREPWLDHHRVHQWPVLAGACHLELALRVAQSHAGGEVAALGGVSFESALFVDEVEPARVRVAAEPAAGGRLGFATSAWDGERWVRHVSGELGRPATALSLPAEIDPRLPPPALARAAGPGEPGADHYAVAEDKGLLYGPAFRTIDRLWRSDGRLLARLELPDLPGLDTEPYIVHPVLLDACFQAAATCFSGPESERLYAPVGVRRLRVTRPRSRELWCLAWPVSASDEGRSLTASAVLMDPDGGPVALIDGLHGRGGTVRRRRRGQ